MALAIVTVILSYLVGAIPVAWLTGCLLAGVDLRRAGSGNAGASNVWQLVSKAAIVPVGIAEVLQGLAGVVFARLTDQGDAVQALAGVAAIAGHDWSPFLGFSGGRGIGHSLGFMLVRSPAALAVFSVISLIGVAVRSIPLAVGAGILLAPVAAAFAGQSRAVVLGMLGMAALVFLKRLLANDPIPANRSRQLYVTRLLYDRDIADRQAWVRRHTSPPRSARPGGEKEAAAGGEGGQHAADESGGAPPGRDQ